MIRKHCSPRSEAQVLADLELDHEFGVGQDFSVLKNLHIQRPYGADDWDGMPEYTLADSRKYLAVIGLITGALMTIGSLTDQTPGEQYPPATTPVVTPVADNQHN